MPAQVGREAPDFTLPGPDGGPVTLSSFRGQRPVVLVFFPSAFSGVCTTQLGAARDQAERYAGAAVLAVSVDNRHSLGAFARSLGLDTVTLLSDFEPKGEVARRYGVYLTERGTSGRAVFVIDESGTLRYAERVPPANLPDEEGLFAALATCTS